MRGLFRGEDPPDGLHYATSSVTAELQPRPGAPIPIWIGSWGSEAGLRRVARLADGWLASGYNTTPEEFGSARERLEEELERQGRSAGLPNALATMWTWITEDRSEAERILADVLGPAVKRDPDYLRPGSAWARSSIASICSPATPTPASSGCSSGRWARSQGSSNSSRSGLMPALA